MALTEDFYKRVAHDVMYKMASQANGNTFGTLMKLIKSTSSTSSVGIRFLTNVANEDGTYKYLYTSNFSFSASSAVTNSLDDGLLTLTAVVTVTNTGTSDFAITEMALVDYCYVTDSSSRALRSLDSTALETPVTVPANNGVAVITYKFQYRYADPA